MKKKKEKWEIGKTIGAQAKRNKRLLLQGHTLKTHLNSCVLLIHFLIIKFNTDINLHNFFTINIECYYMV